MTIYEQYEKGLITQGEATRLLAREIKRSAIESLKATEKIQELLQKWEEALRRGMKYPYVHNPHSEDFNEVE